MQHHERKHGKTKYRFTRLFRGFADLLALSLWYRHRKDPMGFIRNLKIGLILTFFIIISVLTLPFIEGGAASVPLALIFGILGSVISMTIIQNHRNGVLSTTVDLFVSSISRSRVFKVAIFLD